MPDGIFGILDGALVGIVVVGLAVWQLVSINREIARDKAKAKAKGNSPESAGHPVGEHGLDDG